MTKRIKDNEGEVPQYYVENSHPAIIDPAEFDTVQAEMERRKKLGRPSACNSPLSTRIVCGDCGGFYGAKVWGSNTKYRKVIWQCNEKNRQEQKCATPYVTEHDVRRKFVTAFNSVLEYRDELIRNCRLAQEALCDHSAINQVLDTLRQEADVLAGLVRQSSLQAGASQAEGSLPKAYNDYLKRHGETQSHIKELEERKREKQGKKSLLDSYVRNLKEGADCIMAFDERLWAAVVDRVTVMQDGMLVFRFRDGTEIPVGEG